MIFECISANRENSPACAPQIRRRRRHHHYHRHNHNFVINFALGGHHLPDHFHPELNPHSKVPSTDGQQKGAWKEFREFFLPGALLYDFSLIYLIKFVVDHQKTQWKQRNYGSKSQQ